MCQELIKGRINDNIRVKPKIVIKPAPIIEKVSSPNKAIQSVLPFKATTPIVSVAIMPKIFGF